MCGWHGREPPCGPAGRPGARRARPQERARTAARAGEGGPAVRGSAQGQPSGTPAMTPKCGVPGCGPRRPLRAGRQAVRVVEPRVGAARRRAARPLPAPSI